MTTPRRVLNLDPGRIRAYVLAHPLSHEFKVVIAQGRSRWAREWRRICRQEGVTVEPKG